MFFYIGIHGIAEHEKRSTKHRCFSYSLCDWGGEIALFWWKYTRLFILPVQTSCKSGRVLEAALRCFSICAVGLTTSKSP